MAGHRRDKHQRQHGQHHAERLQQQAEQDHGTQDPQQRLDVPARHAIRFAFARHGPGCHHGAEQRQHDAEPEREVARPHLGGRAHGIATGNEGKAESDDDEHQP
ncbi:hypothetical protein D3C81_1896170 [compost metagenome]